MIHPIGFLMVLALAMAEQVSDESSYDSNS